MSINVFSHVVFGFGIPTRSTNAYIIFERDKSEKLSSFGSQANYQKQCNVMVYTIKSVFIEIGTVYFKI